ncbi:MAG TPA: hypothetical protein VFI38_05240 [Candidatus Acidoferrum sp.]|nr:hypothetical protein [Candidatus Acidoferrum sp.]
MKASICASRFALKILPLYQGSEDTETNSQLPVRHIFPAEDRHLSLLFPPSADDKFAWSGDPNSERQR